MGGRGQRRRRAASCAATRRRPGCGAASRRIIMPTSGLCRPSPESRGKGADLAVGKVGIIRHPRRARWINGATEHQGSQRRAFGTAQCVEHPGRPYVAIMLLDSGVTPPDGHEAYDHTSFLARFKRNTWPASTGLCRPGHREIPAKPSGSPKHRHNREVGIMVPCADVGTTTNSVMRTPSRSPERGCRCQ